MLEELDADGVPSLHEIDLASLLNDTMSAVVVNHDISPMKTFEPSSETVPSFQTPDFGTFR